MPFLSVFPRLIKRSIEHRYFRVLWQHYSTCEALVIQTQSCTQIVEKVNRNRERPAESHVKWCVARWKRWTVFPPPKKRDSLLSVKRFLEAVFWTHGSKTISKRLITWTDAIKKNVMRFICSFNRYIETLTSSNRTSTAQISPLLQTRALHLFLNVIWVLFSLARMYKS